MYRRRILSFAGITALGLAVLPSAVGQQKTLKEQIVGSWTYASNETILPDGSRVQTFGPNQSGLVIFGGDGRYVSLVGRAGIPKFASNSRSSGTAEENKAAMQGSIATFGRYTINEADHTLTLNIEYSSFPNWTGTEQKRPFTLAGDELKYVVPVASAGNGRGEVVLRRAK